MASRRPREELVIVAFEDPPEEANCFLARWGGGASPRPSHLVFEVQQSQFLRLSPEQMASRVQTLSEAGSEIYAGYWTDEWPTQESRSKVERVRFLVDWALSNPSPRQLLDLRDCHPVLANRSLTAIRDEIARKKALSFEVSVSSQVEADDLLGRIRALGFHVSIEIVDTAPLWPPES